MLDLAREGGKIVTVVPESLVKDPKFSDFRRLVKEEAIVKAYISLPLSAFYAYGSTIKTGVLYLVKRGPDVEEHKVFFDCARYVGIDRAGRKIEKNDLPMILERFKSFERGASS
jgi:type I restriction enzyme M protein